MHFNFTKTPKSLLLNYVKFPSLNLITKPPQSLRFDTFNIALSYGIHSIASGILLLIILVTKLPHQFLAPLSGTVNGLVIKF
jgi:hypothetical protein